MSTSGPPPGRVVAVDLGERRIGVAVSDELGLSARPLGLVRRVGPKSDARAVRELTSRLSPVLLVVGLPLLPGGGEGEAASRARERAADLARRLELPLELVDERDSTNQARRELLEAGHSSRRRRRGVDAASAAVILQSWLAETEQHRRA